MNFPIDEIGHFEKGPKMARKAVFRNSMSHDLVKFLLPINLCTVTVKFRIQVTQVENRLKR